MTQRTPKKRATQRHSAAHTQAVDWRPRFLNKLRETGNIRSACAAAKISRTTFYAHRKAEADFDAQVGEALEDAGDVLEAEAWRRAVKGVLKPIYQQGGKVGETREYSDTLLIFLLKGTKPEKFRDRHEVSGPGGGPIPFKEIVVELLPEAGASDESAQPVDD
jgi:hypothetical protein